MTRFEMLAEESVRLCECGYSHVSRCCYHFSKANLDKYEGRDDHLHFSKVGCGDDYFVFHLVACIHPDAPDDVSYHAVGACPWRRKE